VVELSGAIPELSEWGNAVIEPDITYYDLEENITAYAFNVMKNSEYDGYIIIPATKDKYPILEFSKGKLPHKISTMAKKSQCTVSNHANKNKLNIGKSIPIYVSNVVSEINANRPFVLCMYGGGARVGGSNDYGNHAVTCMGYYYEGTTQYLNLHDGWDQSATHYITYGNWDSVIPVWMRP
jgi:hypothetical protein